MTGTETFNQALTKREAKLIAKLSSPRKIQQFLDKLAYSTDEMYRCPLDVLRDLKGQCFDGALFGAAALCRIGHRPLVVDLIPNDRDDDHVLALYKVKNHWGAVAKSNFVGLRFREPIYRTLRELVMSYFELYFNVKGEKTLRGYTVPLNLKAFDRYNWMTSDDCLEDIAERLDHIRRVKLLTPAMTRNLSLVDDRSLKSGLSGSVAKGLYRPPRS